MPNAFALLMLSIWPLVCLILLKRMPLERGLIWCLLGGYLFLPPRTEFDLPLVPPMDKASIPSLCAFLILALVLRKRMALWPENRPTRLLMVLFVLGAIPTVLTNGEAVIYGDPGVGAEEFVVGGLGLRDLLSAAVNQAIVILPFLMGRQFLSSEKGLRELLLATMIGGLIYSIPALIEVRLSPQLNTWIYGFFQHSFGQMIRAGGFRPIVFLNHALWLALFMLTALLSTAALARRAAGPESARLFVATIYLAGVLYLCKSLASQAYAVVFLPMVLLTGPRLQLRVTAVLALIAVTYPILRQAGLIPLEAILDWAAAIDTERARSLAFRFENEQILLERAQEKPWFGWGGWGRNLLLDPASGEVQTIPDGRWIIVFGIYGWLGYIAEMGLLGLPLLLLWRRTRSGLPGRFSPHAATVAILLAVTMMDMLLNATLIPLTWLCAGALLGHAEQLAAPGRPAPPEPDRRARAPFFGKGPVIGGRTHGKRRRTIL